MNCGSGYAGSALGLLLAADGHEAFGLHRDSSKLPPVINLVAHAHRRP